MADTEGKKQKGLTDQQRRFCDFVLKGQNQTDAYKLAGYKSKDDDVAAANASRLTGNDKVAAYINAKRAKAVQKVEIDLTWLIEEAVDLYAECRAEGDRGNAGTNIQRLAQLTGNWLDRKETTVILHEDRLDRIRQRLNDIPAKSARLN